MNVVEVAPGLHARVRGQGGEPLLWIHGYTIDSSLWEEIWDELPGWCHIGVDLPGHGRSRPLGDDENLASLGRLLADGALALGIRDVIGLSLGSLIALQVVLDRPAAFRSLAVGAPAIGGGPTDHGAARRFRELASLYSTLGPGSWMTNLWMSSPPEIFTYAAADADLWKRLEGVIDNHSWEELASGGSITRLAQELQPPERLERLDARVLILVGEHEMGAYKETAEILRSHAPVAELVDLPGAGHLCMLEEPALSAGHIRRHLSAAAARR